MSSDDECISPLKRKRGISNSDKYKRNIIKQAKIEGKKYTNWIVKIVAVKNDPSLILLKECCSKKCLKDIQQEKLEDIMKMFYELRSKNEQDLHLQRTIEIKEITRKRKRIETEGKEKPKSKSIQYFLIVDGQRIH
ncbi:Hypothetical protein CINCED_3A017079, partial [Cinara cedri]